jgi:hypothetical protein
MPESTTPPQELNTRLKGADAMSGTQCMTGIRSELPGWIALVLVWAAVISTLLAILAVLLGPAQYRPGSIDDQRVLRETFRARMLPIQQPQKVARP